MENAAFILGEEVRTFERRFAEFTGSAHCINCANGSDALEMAYQALGIGPGDEVLVPAHTWLTTATAATHLGAEPVFVDSHPDSYTLDLADAARKITSRTKAIVPVHIFGQAAPMDEVLALARAHRLKVVEDCAQATGTTYQRPPCRHLGRHRMLQLLSGQKSRRLRRCRRADHAGRKTGRLICAGWAITARSRNTITTFPDATAASTVSRPRCST